jgi:hypothetical protein
LPPINNNVVARDHAKVGKQVGMQFNWGQA